MGRVGPWLLPAPVGVVRVEVGGVLYTLVVTWAKVAVVGFKDAAEDLAGTVDVGASVL